MIASFGLTSLVWRGAFWGNFHIGVFSGHLLVRLILVGTERIGSRRGGIEHGGAMTLRSAVNRKAGGRQVWIELSLLEHWGAQPHGIPRVTQNIFVQSLSRQDIRYFYYHRTRRTFVATQDIRYFIDLAAGSAAYAPHLLPGGLPFSNELGSADSVFFSEAGWDHPEYLGALLDLRARHAGATFQCLTHDLIAIRYPQFFEHDFGSRVRVFLRGLTKVWDRYVCVSESTSRDVRQLLDPSAVTAVVRIGDDIGREVSCVACTGGLGPYVLCVGTQEVRKNHILLYFVWRRLAQQLGQACPKLLMVGRPGWLSGDVMNMFARDPVLSGLIEVRQDISDDLLVGLMRGCLFTVFPSFYEGWGLPVGESYFRGKVCVSSNTSSLPEVNPFPELMFDPYDHQEAFEKILSLISAPSDLMRYEAEIPKVFRPQTWSQFFETLIDLVSE